MRKLLLSLCVLVVVGAAAVAAWHYRLYLFTHLPSTPESELTNREGRIVDSTGKPFSGRKRHNDDEGFSIYSYKDGNLDGLDVVFTDGRFREIGHWENGKQNGLFEAYTETGILIDHANFKDGERDGETLQYWYDTGKLKVKAVYAAGRINGLVEQYWPGGGIQLRHNYVDGVRHGECLDYYEGGQLKSSVTFDHGAQTGPYKLCFEDGTPQEEGFLKEGARNGSFTLYFPNTGKPAVQGTYRMNRYEGEITTWRPDGMKVVQTYRQGTADGRQKSYDPAGRLIGEMMVKNGVADGPFKAYDSRGNVIREGVNKGNAVRESRDSASPQPEGADAPTPDPSAEEDISIEEVP